MKWLSKGEADTFVYFGVKNDSANAFNKGNCISPNLKYYSEDFQWAENFIKNFIKNIK